MNIVSVVGARPQFVKLKPVDSALSRLDQNHIVVHTGQHYDPNMSDVFFSGLSLPEPKFNLDIGSGSHGEMTGKMLSSLESVFTQVQPDYILVYGDTNSTVAAALAAVKMSIPIGHIEAGLRSYNREMPEEINRIVTDHVSNQLFAPTPLAAANLEREGLSQNTYLTGDVMADLVIDLMPKIAEMSHFNFGNKSKPFVVVTIHRASNTDNASQLSRLITSIHNLSHPVILVAHPRLVASAKKFGLSLLAPNIELVEPLPYLEMLSLVHNSIGLITDSGGLQKEAYILGIPCITLRKETEWTETVDSGMNVLAPDGENLDELLAREITHQPREAYGDGSASQKIAAIVCR